MNLSHLRKQAKNLQALFPELVAAHGSRLQLSHAQDAIARIHGYPSWSIAAKKDAGGPAETTVAGPMNPIVDAIRVGYVFHLSQEEELAIKLDDDGDPKKYAIGREATLARVREVDDESVRRASDAFDQLTDRLGGMFGDFRDFSPEVLQRLIDAARASVKGCPLHIEAWNFIGGALFEQGNYTESMAVVEPVATALLSLLPAKGVIQVCYGVLDNRPFFRIVHCYLLLLDKAGRHPEADALAKRMYALWPNDNMGFRFLLTRKQRRQEG